MQELEYLLQQFANDKLSITQLQRLQYLLKLHQNKLSEDALQNFSNVDTAVANRITDEKSAEMLNYLHFKLQMDTKNDISSTTKIVSFVSNFKRFAAVACVAGFMLVSGYWIFNNVYNGKKIAAMPKVSDTALHVLKTFENNTTSNQSVKLLDGSIITITPNSAIRYYQPFIQNRRDISLQGTALFKVAKDKTKPFIVYANGISTRALGTSFWVKTNIENIVNIQLIEGKVEIKGVLNDGIAMKTVYLMPGEEVLINKQNHLVAVNKIKSNAEIVIAKQESKNNTHHTLSFDRTPLVAVIKTIAKQYNISINYTASDLANLSFTGSFLTTDTLSTILTIICNTNNLSFTEEEGVYTIHR